jgi:pilus assembly protein Flp/PilA
MKALMRIISGLTNREEGQTLTEYALLLFFIAIVVIGVVTLLGTQISTVFNNVLTALQGGS